MCFFHMSKMNRLLTKSGRNSPDLSGLVNMKMVMRWHFFPSFIFISLAFISFWLFVGLVVFHWIKVILLIISFFQISYTGVGKTQLNFLRLLSEKATQTFDLTCKGSQGCFDSKSNALEKAIRLQGANDGILSYLKNDPTVKITKVWADSYDKYENDTDLAKS